MSFCATRTQFAAGWFGGGNRRRFAVMASEGTPMGIVARAEGTPVGWGACGPRSRYAGPNPADHPLLGGRPRTEDETVWLVPCLFVRAGQRRRGVSHALVEAAVALAAAHGAVAVEAWPLSAATGNASDAFVGREALFTELGFRRVAEPGPGRTIMRVELDRGSLLDP